MGDTTNLGQNSYGDTPLGWYISLSSGVGFNPIEVWDILRDQYPSVGVFQADIEKLVATGKLTRDLDRSLYCRIARPVEEANVEPPAPVRLHQPQRTGECELEVELQVKIKTWGIPTRHEKKVATSVARAITYQVGLDAEVNVAIPDETAPRGVRYEPVLFNRKAHGGVDHEVAGSS